LPSYLSKSRLRALNTQNQSILPRHSNLNGKSLKSTWKVWLSVLYDFIGQKNRKLILGKQINFNRLNLNLSGVRRLKKNIFISKRLILCNKSFLLNKKYYTHVRVIHSQFKTIILTSNYPRYRILTNLIRRLKVTKKRMLVNCKNKLYVL